MEVFSRHAGPGACAISTDRFGPESARTASAGNGQDDLRCQVRGDRSTAIGQVL